MESNSNRRFQERQNTFQQIDPYEHKRRRENFAVELRKQKRDNRTAKRRAKISVAGYMLYFKAKENLTMPEVPVALVKYKPELASDSLNPVDKLQIIKDLLLNEGDTNLKVEGLNAILELLNDEQSPLGTLVQLGFTEMFQVFIDFNIYPTNIIYPATACLANICTAPHELMTHFFSTSIVSKFLSALNLRTLTICNLALRGLANIAGDSYEFRKVLLSKGVIHEVSSFLDGLKNNIHTVVEPVSHLLNNLCENAEDIEINDLDRMVQWIGVLTQSTNSNVKKDCLNAIMKITSVDEERIQLILDNQLGSYAVQGLHSTEKRALLHSLSILSNILEITEEYTHKLLGLGMLDKLMPCLSHSNSRIRAKAYLLLSNLVAGTKEHINFFLNHSVSSLSVSGLLDSNLEVRKECSYMLKNLFIKGTVSQKLELVKYGIIETLKESFDDYDAYLSKKLLDISFRLLVTGMEHSEISGEEPNQMVELFMDSGCAEEIEALTMRTENPKVAKLATSICAEFFDEACNSQELTNKPSGQFEFS